MSATILSRTISSEEDKRLVLSNDQAVRLIDIGTGWTKLRIGLRWCANGSITLTGTPELAVGVCSGVTNAYGDATTDHFVGARTNAASWTFTAGAPAYFDFGTTTSQAVKKVGTTKTGSGTTYSAWRGITATPASHRCGFFVEIQKGSPNFTIVAASFNNTATGVFDLSLAQFLAAMEIADLTSINTTLTGYSGQGITLAVDEGADGDLNAINIYWPRTSASIEISDVAYSRIA